MASLCSYEMTKNKFTRAKIKIFDQPALNYKLMRVFTDPFVGFCLFEIRKIAVYFFWLLLPGDCRVTDEALLAETM